MIRIDENLLIELGLGALPATEKQPFLKHIYETLEMRVGMKLAEQMTEAQLDEFEAFIDTNDEAGALKWLESNFPDYKQVVVQELEKLKAEIKQDAQKILETYQTAPPAPEVPPQSTQQIN
jgi:predicted RNA-binding Zn ribbon-like protein